MRRFVEKRHLLLLTRLPRLRPAIYALIGKICARGPPPPNHSRNKREKNGGQIERQHERARERHGVVFSFRVSPRVNGIVTLSLARAHGLSCFVSIGWAKEKARTASLWRTWRPLNKPITSRQNAHGLHSFPLRIYQRAECPANDAGETRISSPGGSNEPESEKQKRKHTESPASETNSTADGHRRRRALGPHQLAPIFVFSPASPLSSNTKRGVPARAANNGPRRSLEKEALVSASEYTDQ